MESYALIICNLQNDFCEGGIYPIEKSLSVVPTINRIRDYFKIVIFIKKWHPINHCSFNNNGGNWLPNCIQNTIGANINSGIEIKDTDYVIHIGTLSLYESSSGFYNAKTLDEKTNLHSILQKNKISNLYFCGLFMEEFIFSSIYDALMYGYKCFLIKDISLAHNKDKEEKAISFFLMNNVTFINSTHFYKKNLITMDSSS